MTFNFLAPKFIYLKRVMTELGQGLDIQVPTGQTGNLQGWVPRAVIPVYTVGVARVTLSRKHAPRPGAPLGPFLTSPPTF